MEIEAVAESAETPEKRKTSLKSSGDAKLSKSSSKKSSKKRRKRDVELAQKETKTEDVAEDAWATSRIFKQAGPAKGNAGAATEDTAKAPSPKAFPLVSKQSFPSKEDVKSMSGEDQHKFFKSLGSSCEKLLRLIDEVEMETSLWRDSAPEPRDAEEAAMALEDTLLSDMARLKNAPIARQFTELSLWKRVKKFNEKQLAHIESLYKLDGAGGSDGGEKADAAAEDKKTRDFVSFKQAHMSHMTSQYEKDLEAIRKAETLDVAGVETLLRLLDVSTDLYAETLVREQKEEERALRL